MDGETKVCSKCKIEKSTKEFYFDKKFDGKQTIRSQCKICYCGNKKIKSERNTIYKKFTDEFYEYYECRDGKRLKRLYEAIKSHRESRGTV